MEWTRSETLALAAQCCSQCHGLGLRENNKGEQLPCNCVFRSIFRACYARFRHSVMKEKRYTHVALEYSAHGGRRITWGRKDEEYIADFLLVCRRFLSDAEHQVFRYHFLLGADWNLCVRKLNISRGTFFHTVYRIQQRLGRVFRELKPYALFPLDEYFNGRTENETPSRLRDPRRVVAMRPNSLMRRLDVPVRKVA